MIWVSHKQQKRQFCDFDQLWIEGNTPVNPVLLSSCPEGLRTVGWLLDNVSSRIVFWWDHLFRKQLAQAEYLRIHYAKATNWLNIILVCPKYFISCNWSSVSHDQCTCPSKCNWRMHNAPNHRITLARNSSQASVIEHPEPLKIYKAHQPWFPSILQGCHIYHLMIDEFRVFAIDVS